MPVTTRSDESDRTKGRRLCRDGRHGGPSSDGALLRRTPPHAGVSRKLPAQHATRHAGTKRRLCHSSSAARRGARFIFLSLEDETGIANAIIDPELYEQNRNLVTYGKILLIEGMLQNIDKVVHVRMQRITELTIDTQLSLKSHDLH